MVPVTTALLTVAWLTLGPVVAAVPASPNPTTSSSPTSSPSPSSRASPSPTPTATLLPPAAPNAPAAALDNSGHLYTMDGWGGVHPAGASPPITTSAYWPGWDIARGMAVLADGSGAYVLDGFGGVHEAGAATRVTSGDYFGGFDIARAIALAPWSTAGSPAGWVLDGFGAVHAFGSAPQVNGSAYWGGWDIARSLIVLPDSTPSQVSGYVLDGWGGLHPFGAAQPVNSAYWPNWDIARAAVVLPGSTVAQPAGYVLDGWGGLHPYGSAKPIIQSAYWPNWDIARGVVAWNAAPAGSPGGWVMEGWGGLHPYGSAVNVAQSAYWPNWDIARSLGTAANSSAGRNQVAALKRVLNVPYYHQQYALSCEAAALRMALAKEGINVAEDTLLSGLAPDNRSGYYDSNGRLRWGNPYNNFVGNVNGSEGALTGYGVYYPPVARVAGQYGGSVLTAGEGINPATVYEQVLAGHPVVAWVSYDRTYHSLYSYQAYDGRWVNWYPTEHAVVVYGVDQGTVLVHDPIRGTEWWPKGTFESAYATFNFMAVILN